MLLTRGVVRSVASDYADEAMILVIGGRSKIGSALLGDLRARGEEVRALTRPSENATGFPDGVEVVVGDLADPASLSAAVDEVDKVFLLCGPNPDEVALNRNAIDAAAGADVELLVRSSILGADSGSPTAFVQHHGECDEYLRSADLDYAIVRPNMFMENIPESTVPSIDAQGNFYVNAGDARLSMVGTRDVAAVAAVLLTEPGHAGDEVDVTGPEALSYADVAVLLTQTMGRQINYVPVPDEAVRSALSGYGMGDWMVNSLVELFADYRRSGTDGYASAVTDTVERLTGNKPRTLDAMLAEPAP
jgi:uncharacterized protein YbjT (DUF2867 family)